jgi:hypothetical protein
MDVFDKITTRLDADRLHDETNTEQRRAFAKSRKRTLAVKDVVIPNDYRPLDYDRYEALLPDIEARGIRERIEVYEKGSRYILLHGRLRLEAARRLKLDEIKAVVLSEWRPKIEPRPKAPTGPLPNELELVRKARKGDEEARNRLVKHYYRVATTVAGKRKGKMEFGDADSVAFDAITKAIDTWNPKVAKLSTWIGQKVRGELTALRRQLWGQNRQADWIERKTRWLRPRNAKRTPLNGGGPVKVGDKVRYERLDDPKVCVVATVKKRKRGIDKTPGEILCREEIEMRYYRRQVRAEHRLFTLERILKENPRFQAWRKQRKGFNINKQDQRIVEMLFFENVLVEWDVSIGGKNYYCHIAAPQNWLPDEICDELGITKSKFNAALARICKQVTGFTDKELIALEDVRAGERRERVQAIAVPEPNLPPKLRKVLAAISPEPTFDEAAKAVAEYWRQLVKRPGDLSDCALIAEAMSSGDDIGFNPKVSVASVLGGLAQINVERCQRQIALEVSEAIKGRTGPEYLRLAQCIEVLKRSR